MFTLNPSEITRFDISNAHTFVDFWSRFYKDTVRVFKSKEPINYFDELNIGNELTDENVRHLPIRAKMFDELASFIGGKRK